MMAKSNQGGGGLHSNKRSILERCTHKIPHSAEAGLEMTLLASWSWQDARDEMAYSVNTTDCTLVISKRFRQRMFLQAIRSSLRNI